MKGTSSKDLLLIFVLSSIIAIFTSTQPFNIFILDIFLFILIIVLSGYSLMSLIYPEEDSTGLLRKPFLITMFSMFLVILISLMLKISPLGLHFRDLTWFISIITALVAVTAYMMRIKHFRPKIEESAEELIPLKSHKLWDKNLIIYILLSLLMIITVLVPPLNKTPVWMVPGSLFVCLIPGYLLLAVMFPKNDDLELIERLALSFGSSLILTSIIGLIFNYTRWGIHLELILIVLAIFSLLLCFITVLKMRKLPVNRRIRVPKLDKTLGIFLIICILLTIGTAAYTLINSEDFNTNGSATNATSFYIKDLDSNAGGYTLNLVSGEQTSLTMVLVNQEGSTVNYSIVVRTNNSILKQENVSLEHNQKMEIPVDLTAGIPGERNIEFLLYKLPDQNPYQTRIVKLNVS
ncbi:DUF1616 domain-containing protein [Methanobacterium petrolearium]|uniref:DUF1616 domain-containing protein n=1 Tax=Methanobacterium petrolearium TaxID=710190 RepID=UPI001AE38999|nr:DUF1616 domain-containing protein [Methanobacterium petrolearium]MBP1947045.1 putative membrane protein [Methanobacterium petrolearium]